MRTVLGFASTGTERPIIAKGNAGIPKYHDGHIHYDGTPELMAEYAVLARDAGRADHRRLLRHHAGASARDARGAGNAARRARARRWRISRPIWAGSPRPRTGRAIPRAIRSASGAAGGADEILAARILQISCSRNLGHGLAAQNSDSWSPAFGGGREKVGAQRRQALHPAPAACAQGRRGGGSGRPRGPVRSSGCRTPGHSRARRAIRAPGP